jgi:hypothetical protein
MNTRHTMPLLMLLIAFGLLLSSCDKPSQSAGTPDTAPTIAATDAATAAPPGQPAVSSAPASLVAAEPTVLSDDGAGLSIEVKDTALAAAAGGDPFDRVSATLDGYLARQGSAGGNSLALVGGVRVQFGRGQAHTAVPPGSPGFTDARALAFEQAFQNALGDLVQRRAQRITTEVLSERYQNTADTTSLLDACKPNVDEQMTEKALKLVDALMNAALKSLDSAAESAAPVVAPALRCENLKLKEAITQKITTTAAASMAGVRIVKSCSEDGEVGVVVAVSPKFIDAAYTLARGDTARQPLADPVGELTTAIGELEPAGLLGTYGTRSFRLSNGEYAVIAFGQAGANVTANDEGAFRSAKRRSAQSSAQRSAEAQLAQFAKVTTYFSSQESRHAGIATRAVVENGTYSEQNSQEVGRELSERIRSAASLDVSGAMPIRRWSAVDPSSGDLVEGVLIAWSPSMKATTLNTGPSAGVGGPNGGNVQREKSESKEYEEDF